MNFERWFNNQRESWNVSLSEFTQNVSIMEQADKRILNFSYLEEEIVRNINKYDC